MKTYVNLNRRLLRAYCSDDSIVQMVVLYIPYMISKNVNKSTATSLNYLLRYAPTRGTLQLINTCAITRSGRMKKISTFR